MAVPKKRYWAYEHDSDGDLTEDLGEFDSFYLALEAVGYGLKEDYIHDELKWARTYRIVDNDLQGGTTIWLAGPVARDSEMRPVI